MQDIANDEPIVFETVDGNADDRYRLLVDAVTDCGIVMLDLTGQVCSWNAGAQKIAGYRAGEILGKHFSRLYTSEDVAAGKPQRALEIVRSEGRFEEESLRHRKGGSPYWAAVTITVIHDSLGIPIGFAKLFRDVTERKYDEEMRGTSEQRFRGAFEQTAVATALIDIEKRFIRVNAAFARMFGYSPDEMLGMSMDEITHPPDLAARIGDPTTLASGGAEEYQSEKRYRHRDGRTLWGQTSVSLVRGANGRPLLYVGQVQDITGRRRLLGERDALLARLQLHIQRMPLAYILFDAELRIRDWNPAATRIFGYTKDEMLGQGPPYGQFVSASAWPEAEATIGRIRTGDIHVNWINENLTKDGRKIACDWFITPIVDDGGSFGGFIGLAQDVTEQKSLQAQFYQSQKMEAIGQLAGGVAHDFNNLLTIISGNSELLLGKLTADDPKAVALRAISDAGQRAAGLTRQLLEFSRRAAIDKKVLDLNAVVRETESMLGRLIGEDIQFTLSLDSSIDRIKADPGQIGQILINLAVNARDAMPRGGTLSVETSSIELDATGAARYPGFLPGRYVRLAVRDSGRGMTDEIRARIFEPFFTTKKPGKGTGLGLATVYGIVKQCGGGIDVDTEPDRGTTFSIFFPAVDEPLPPAALERATGSVAGGNETILLVEDDDAVRAIAVIALEMRGYTVIQADCGARAIELVDTFEGRIDLLVTDVVLPGLNGRELAEKIVSRFPNLKVLYQSGYTDDSVVRHGVLAAEVAFLQKPYSPSSLARRVRELLDK